MKDTLRSATPVDLEVTGEPVEAHGYIVTPVARMRGRLGSSGDEKSSGRYGWLMIRPLSVTVQDRDGNTRDVQIVNVQTQLTLRLVAVGIFVALASVLVPMLLRSKRR